MLVTMKHKQMENVCKYLERSFEVGSFTRTLILICWFMKFLQAIAFADKTVIMILNILQILVLNSMKFLKKLKSNFMSKTW